MTPEDISTVFELRLKTRENVVTKEDLDAYAISTESITRALARNVAGWVYEREDEIIGFTMGDGGTGELLVLAVHPDHEGLGAGGQLLREAQRWLFSKGHESLFLKTGHDPSFRAYGFYQHLGWEPTGRLEGSDEVFVLQRLVWQALAKP